MGVAYSFRDAKANSARFRAQPEARFGAATPDVPFFVDTGIIPAQHYQLIGSEIAAVFGPLSIQAEYVYSPVALAAGGIASFHGWYVLTSLFLTGEHRPYRKDDGTFDRVIPIEDFLPSDANQSRGSGAWEIAMRLSQVDLDDGAIRGGRITNLTAGVNWYLNRHTRVSANYIHSFLVRAPVGRSDADIFALRVGYDF
jgi:phosphate-selective porin OprO/OprP